MTIPPNDVKLSDRAHFRQVLADHGMTEAHGVELLRLIKMVANSFETIMVEQMRDANLSAPRWRLLLRLYSEERQGNCSVSPTHLSRVQDVSKNTISAMLRSLEEQGLIERSLDAQDGRRFRISLSERGRVLIRTSTPKHIAFLNGLLADLSPLEREELTGLLYKLHTSLVNHAGSGT